MSDDDETKKDKTDISVDENFEELIITDISYPLKAFVQCTKHQREFLETLKNKKGWSYKRLVRYCQVETGRGEEIKDIGHLSKGEASMLIKKMGGYIVE